MNNKIKYLSLGLALTVGLGACQKSLDINTNPNSPIESTPALVLPQAMVATAQLVPQFNTYGSRLVGYYATSGGVSGWSDMITYDFTTGNFTGLWSNTYNVLADLDYVIKNTAEVPEYQHFNHAAEVLRAYNFANLVDTYNDIPYSEALQGSLNISPKYDEASTIYVDLATRLDNAVAFFKNADDDVTFDGADVLFKGDTKNWAKFANTLKLRLLLRANGKAAFAKTSIDDIGVLSIDAIVQPSFTKIDGKQNPMWNTWAYSASNAAVGTFGTQFIPTVYVMGFYDGAKIADETRASLVFANGVSTNKNQLGETEGAPTGIAPSAWVQRPLSGSISATNYRGTGVVKGPAAGQPLLLAAESQLLAAEGVTEGLVSGNFVDYFKAGIKASYTYLQMNETGAIDPSAATADAFLTDYLEDNKTNVLVNPDSLTTDLRRLEAVITQKYIALNFLFGHEAWNEYRRTGYPKISGSNTPANALTTFVSTESRSTAADRLPTRILYPNTEYNYNAKNVPEINKYSDKIFWAK